MSFSSIDMKLEEMGKTIACNSHLLNQLIPYWNYDPTSLLGSHIQAQFCQMRLWFEQLYLSTHTLLRDIQGLFEIYLDFQRSRPVEVPELSEIQRVCELFFQHLSDVNEQFEQLHYNRMLQLMCIMDNSSEHTVNFWWTSVFKFMQELLRSSLIYEEQPPSIIRKDKKFEAKIRWLIGSKIETIGVIEELTGIISILNEDMVKTAKQGIFSENAASLIQNAMINFEMNPNKEISAKLRGCKIMHVNRSGSKKSDKKIHEKFAILFQTKIVWKNVEINIPLISLPICLTTNISQDEYLQATIMWDYAFAERERLSFEVPDSIQWFQLAEALSRMWKNSIGSPLTDNHIKYLYHKIFSYYPVSDVNPSQLVTWNQIAKDHLNGQSFTFWSWFYGAMKLIEDTFKDHWNTGHIYGYVTRHQAHLLLKNKPIGTFLFRFTESVIGNMSIDVKTEDDVASYGPFKTFPGKTLDDFILNCEGLQYLYPGVLVCNIFTRQDSLCRNKKWYRYLKTIHKLY